MSYVIEVALWVWQVEAAQAARQKAEEQIAALTQSHKAEMEAEKSHYEALLQKARSAQVCRCCSSDQCTHRLPCILSHMIRLNAARE